MVSIRRRDVLTGVAAGAAGLLAGCTGTGASATGQTSGTGGAPGSDQARPAVSFPPGFRWGVATSAYQIEGATTADGRGASIWDTFAAQPGRIADGSTAARACDHYHRMPADLDLLKSLGVGSYRFSVAWPRVLPEGRGTVNRAGLGFYDRLLDGLAARGISAMLTLYHWDLPQTLQDKGGWENRDCADWFAAYADVLYRSLGDRVAHWLTINEAKIIVQQGYQFGRMAPGLTDPAAAGRVVHHLGLGHGRAVQALRASTAKGAVGPCLQLAPCYPADDSPEAARATALADITENTLYLDPLLHGRYPSGLERIEPVMAKALTAAVHPGDLKIISTPVDYLGVNYYSPAVIGPAGPVQKYPVSPAGWQQIYPAGLRDAVLRLHRDYGAPQIVITENGVPDEAGGDPQKDDARITVLRDHLLALHDALTAGANVTGYHAWSLMDNFEWASGYTQRWGLVHVAFDTLARTTKDSGHWYRTVATGNRVPQP